MAERSAVIVGGGIGGLATAVALHRLGWRVEVLERAARFTEIEAGLSLWPNAVRAVHQTGDAAIVEHGQGVSRADLVVAADGVRSVVRRQWWPGGGCLALEDAVTLAACLDTAPNLKALRGMDSILGWAVR